MASRRGLIAAGFGVAPSTHRVQQVEQPPLQKALSKAASFASSTLRVGRRVVAALPPSSRTPALAAGVLAALGLLAAAASLPTPLVLFLLASASASALLAWARRKGAANGSLSVPPSLGMSSTSSLSSSSSSVLRSPRRKALSSPASASPSTSATATPTKGGCGRITVVVDARPPEITAAE